MLITLWLPLPSGEMWRMQNERLETQTCKQAMHTRWFVCGLSGFVGVSVGNHSTVQTTSSKLAQYMQLTDGYAMDSKKIYGGQ